MIKKAVFFFCLGSFAVFLSMGNLFRLVPSSLFSDSLSLSEATFYLFSCISFFFLHSFYKTFLRLLCIASLLTASFLYGWYLHGWDLHASLYAARFILMFSSCFIMSEVAFEFFQGSLQSFFAFLCKIYWVALILGFTLYFFFPESDLLWQMLDEHHIGFQGDPHVGRFVSVYFDPNYYCSIAALVFLMTSYLYDVTKKKSYLVLGILCFASSLLSWSRSGLFVWGCLFLYRMYGIFFRGLFSKRHIWGLGAILVFCLIGLLRYAEEAAIFWDRTIHFFEEESALCRLRTFQFGWDLLSQYPLFGVGTNFLYSYTTQAIGLNSLDSSFLALLVQIGWIPFVIGVFYGCYRAFFLIHLNRLWQNQEEKSSYFFSWFCFYGLLIATFASQFNNLLFYPFWIIPFTAILLFLVKKVKKINLPIVS